MLCGCGIPSVTLEGTKSDWETILDRIDKIPEFGEEPKEWAEMLRVILRRFIRAFDKGGPPRSDQAFWERMIDKAGLSAGNYISGWMSAFCAWDNKGIFFECRTRQGNGKEVLVFDGVTFPRVYSPPEGYAEVDVILVDLISKEKMDCTMLAGHIGMAVEGRMQDTIRIAPQWFMYVKGKKRGNVGMGFWNPA